MRQKVYYQFEAKKNENTFTVNKRFSICSFSEILKELTGPESGSFIMIYSIPYPATVDLITDPKRRSMSIMRFINTKNPYTPNLREIFSEISVFIGEVTKDVEQEFPVHLNQTQREFLSLLTKPIKNLALYCQTLLEIMKYKIEIEVNSNQLLRREVLFVLLMAIEKENLSSRCSLDGELLLAKLDEYLELIGNILNNQIGRSSSKDKFSKYIGNFMFDKNVLVLTQNLGFKKIKNKQEATQKRLNLNRDQSQKTYGSRKSSKAKLDPSPQGRKRKLGDRKDSAQDERKNTVTFLLKN